MAKRKATVKWMGHTLHIETPNGVVNIRCGLVDVYGRSVDSISVTPDEYYGEQKVLLRGLHNTRLIRCKGARNKEGKL